MKLTTKKLIDKHLGSPLLMLIGLLASIFSIFGSLRRRVEFQSDDSIVIMKFQGIGSLALAKPAIAALKKRHPSVQIYFWGTPSTVALAQLMPEFAGCFTLDDGSPIKCLSSIGKNLIQIWRIAPRWAFDLEVYSRLSSLLTMLTFAPYRAGFAIDVVGNRRYTHTHLLLFNRYKWIGLAYARLLNLVDHQDVDEHRIEFGTWNIDLRRHFRLEGQNYAVLNLHSGELATERQWPIERFVELARLMLAEKPDRKIVIIGKGPIERERSDKFAKNFDGDSVICLANELSLAETLNVLHFADLVVTGDSGPMHLAMAVGTPTVGIFGPTRPESYMVQTQSWRYISRQLYCSPCVHHWDTPPCGGDNQCMKGISAKAVFELTHGLSRTSTAAHVIELKPKNPFYEGLVYKAA